MGVKFDQLENWLYGLALIIAALVRFAFLGAFPLSDSEASLALQALSLADGASSGVIGPQAGYVVWTGGLFFLFEGNAFWARFVPALVGTAMVLAPFFLRSVLGREAAVLAAFLVAIDPGLVALSKTAGGEIIGMTFLLLGCGLLIQKRAVASGTAFGFALLGGASVWAGVVSFGIALGLVRWSRRLFANLDQMPSDGGFQLSSPQWRPFFISLAVSVFIGASLFFTVPQGFSAMASALPAYVGGWGAIPDTFLVQVIAALLAYELFIFLPGLWRIFFGGVTHSAIDRFLAIWLLVSFGLLMAYPGRTVLGLGWVILPLIGLAARQIAILFNWRDLFVDWQAALGLSLMIVVLIGFAWLNLLKVTNTILGDQEGTLRWVGIGGALFLLVAISILVGWGWSRNAAYAGALFGFIAVGLVLTLGATWHSARLVNEPLHELWYQDGLTPELELMGSSVGDISEWNTGYRDQMDVIVLDVNSPALEWALRRVNQAKFVDFIPGGQTPGMVIALKGLSMNLGAEYSGQDFIISERPAWPLLSPTDWLHWLAFRDVQALRTDVILWVRTDMFPGVEETLIVE
jgi:hypothetical protein